MFKVYKRIGGGTTFDKYSQHLKLFFYHTLNSHVFGMGSADYDGAATDKQGYALHGSIDAAEAALIDAANIDYTEVRLIFNSVDAVQPYS